MVVAGPGDADEDRTAQVLARALRDAGVEVVYTDRPQAADQLAATVVQEDADAVAVVPAGDDEAPVRRVRELLADRGIDDVLVVAGADLGAPAGAADALRARLRG